MVTTIPRLFILVSMLVLLLLPFSYALDSVSVELESNKLYDNAFSFNINDTQSFTIDDDVIITNVQIIAKTNISAYNTIQLTIKDTINNSIGQSLQTSSNSNVINQYTQLNFPFTLGVTQGTYWLDFGGTTYHSFYSDDSAIDTYVDGGVNALTSTHDLYFVVQGYYTNENNSISVFEEASDPITDFFGTDSFILFLVSLLIIFAILVYTKQKIKNDYIVIACVIGATILCYLIGILSFYIAGLFIIADIIFAFAFKGETTK